MGQARVQKARILEQAEKLFWEKGYARATIKDIADACNFRTGNIYYYFLNKEDILWEILSGQMGELVSSIRHFENDEDGNPLEQLKTLISEHVNLTLGPWSLSGMLFDFELKSLTPAHRKQLIEERDLYDNILRKILERGIKQGLFNKHCDVPITAINIASMIVRSRLWFSNKGRLSREDLSNEIFKFVVYGICLRPDILSVTNS
jgi:AcrR family transcriptional regulator